MIWRDIIKKEGQLWRITTYRIWIPEETDRRILKRRLIDGLTFSQLSAEFHLCERQIKNRVYKAQERLFKNI